MKKKTKKFFFYITTSINDEHKFFFFFLYAIKLVILLTNKQSLVSVEVQSIYEWCQWDSNPESLAFEPNTQFIELHPAACISYFTKLMNLSNS